MSERNMVTMNYEKIMLLSPKVEEVKTPILPSKLTKSINCYI